MIPAGDEGASARKPLDPCVGSISAEEAARARRALLAHARHELRTPLNAIIGYTEMLIDDAEETASENVVRDLRRIHSSGRTLLALVNEILDPTVIEGSLDLDLDDYASRIRHALRTPLSDVLGYCELILEEGNDPAVQDLAPELRKVHLAGIRLLSLSEDIQSFLHVDGAPESPAARPSALAHDIAGAYHGAPAHPRAAESGGVILVVDDNETNRDLLSRRLGRQGYTVHVAEDGIRALAFLEREPCDLVLLDVMMPGLNGFQVLDRMKADPALQHLPVIMISALDDLDSIVRCIERGADDYLPKPFDPVLLRARIGACMEKKRLRDREVLYLNQIEQEKQISDRLLHVILPNKIVEELKETNRVQPRRREGVAVLFCDIVAFTPYCESRPLDEVSFHLQQLVEAYEELALKYELEKIKTIGDSFMATCGLLRPMENSVRNCVQCGLEMIATARRLPPQWEVGVGIHVGPVMAGLVGKRQYLFDVWGDTVNTAARVESHGLDGGVNLSRAAWDAVSASYEGRSLGLIPVKGKGELEIIYIEPPFRTS